jgi:hypothetical protein
MEAFTMAYEQLIYTSQISPQFSYEDIGNIMISANYNNAQRNITGALCLFDQTFIQYLEGNCQNINSLFQVISKDKRHDEIQIRYYGQCTERLFEHWKMNQIEPEILQELNCLSNYILTDQVSVISPEDAIKTFQAISTIIKADHE